MKIVGVRVSSMKTVAVTFYSTRKSWASQVWAVCGPKVGVANFFFGSIGY